MKASAMTDQQASLGLEGRELVHLGRDNCGDADRAQDLFHRPPSRHPRTSAWSGSQLNGLAVVAMVSVLVGSEKSAPEKLLMSLSAALPTFAYRLYLLSLSFLCLFQSFVQSVFVRTRTRHPSLSLVRVTFGA